MEKKVEIRKMELRNFKGIRELNVELSHRTDICGRNATGKTTLFDAFTWCLFGKDHEDRTDTGRGSFALKTQGTNGKPIDKLDHSVAITLVVNGVEIRLQRILKEKWVKKVRAKELVFEGNTTYYLWNDVELKASEFDRRIEAEIISAQQFKMLTNPHYFSSLSWQDQLEILNKIVGTPSLEEIAEGNELYQSIVGRMTASDSLAEMRQSNRANRTRLKKRLEEIEPMIVGLTEGTPTAPDYETLNAEKDQLNAELDGLIATQQSALEAEQSRFSAIREREKERTSLLIKQKEIERERLIELNSEYNRLVTERANVGSLLETKTSDGIRLRGEIDRRESIIKEMDSSIDKLKAKREALLEEWSVEDGRVFDSGDVCCPITNKPCDSIATKSWALTHREKAFNELKANKLKEIEEKGQRNNDDISRAVQEKESNLSQLQALTEKVQVIEKECRDLRQWLDKNPPVEEKTSLTNDELLAIPEWEDLSERIRELTLTAEQEMSGNILAIKNNPRINDIRERLDSINAELGKKSVIEANQRRIAELEEEAGNISQQLADLEMEDEAMRNMEEAQIAEVGNRANKLCRFVKFNTCDHQINGEPIRTCYATVNGVRFADLNSAMKINAGLDIINAFGKRYETSLPIFIDNAESVNVLEETDNQVICLQVTNGDLEIITH